jgi:hypothetical protein
MAPQGCWEESAAETPKHENRGCSSENTKTAGVISTFSNVFLIITMVKGSGPPLYYGFVAVA